MMEVPQKKFSRGPCFFEEVLMIQEAPKAQKMLKNKSSQNWMKPIPLQPSRCADSGSIFTFSKRSRRLPRLRKCSKIKVLRIG
jgi:hypothetical protein